MDISKLCRSCMKEVASWELQNFDEKAVDMFTFSTHIQITEDEPKLPKQFCYECIIKTESAYTFIKKAHEVDIRLKNLVLRMATTVIIEPENNAKRIPTPFKLCEEDYLFNFEENSSHNHGLISGELNDQQNKTISKINHKEKDFKSIEHLNNEVQVKKPQNASKEKRKKSQLICAMCNKTFVSKVYLSRHLQRKHVDIFRPKNTLKMEKNLKGNDSRCETKVEEVKACPLCNKNFKSQLWFLRHMEKAHAYPKAHSCPNCAKTFLTAHQLRYHLLSHSSQRPFQCACGAAFSTRKRLAAHALIHSDDRPHACHKCDMRFKIKSILTNHMKVHESEKPFLCSICGWGFAQAFNLTVHMRKHTGERPHSCPHCSFVTSTLSCLTRHKRRHLASRPYGCVTCQKRFYELGALRRHGRTHTGARPYRCPHCVLAFTDSWKRKTHLMRIHQYTLQDIPPLTIDGRPKI